MSIQYASFAPKVMLAPGGVYQAKSSYNRRQHEGIPVVRMPDGSLHFYLDDNRRRIRFPTTSIAWLLEDSEPVEFEPPLVTWQLATVVFKTEVHIGGTRISTIFWEQSKYPEIACVETENGVRLEMPDGRAARIPWHMIASLVDRASAVSVPATEPRNDWPATETTPAQPPRRPAPRKP